MSSSIPDRTLAAAMRLPWPANRIAFAALRRLYGHRGRRTGELTTIRFNSVAIQAPLSHPSVFWRYRPAGANMNFLRLARMASSARPGILIDVGANIGDGIALLRGNGVEVGVLAVEGAPEFAELMRTNVAHLHGVEIAVCLLAEQENDDLVLSTANGTGAPVKGVSDVSVDTLDHLCQTRGVQHVALIKIDTDGFDAKVLRGARRLLRESGPPLFFEMADLLLRQNGDNAEDLVRFLQAQGYETIIAWDNDGRFVGDRMISEGVRDWISRYPGGEQGIFIDIAAFKAADRRLFDEIVSVEKARR